MQVQFLNTPEFIIDESGRLQRSGSWLLSVADAAADISKQAEEWAGAINDPWRNPNPDGTDYTLDDNLKVCRIECSTLDSRHCQVKFTAAAHTILPGENDPESVAAVAGSFIFERKKDLTEYKTIRYKLSENNLALLPQVGSVINWAGSDYRCESLTCRTDANNQMIAEVKAVNIAIEQVGRIKSEERHDERFKTGSWMIMPEALEAFLQQNALHKAAEWAGEDFYIYQVCTAPGDSAKRTQVILTARYSKLEILESLRSEEIKSMVMSVPDTTFVWQSRWRATAEDRGIFENKLGSLAQDWTNDDQAIICKVTPKRISDCEFEYTMEARRPEDINSRNNFDLKDLELPNRLEYYSRVGEMRLSAGQCGYTWRHNGTYRTINNWQSAQLCPLSTTTVLAQRWINQPVKLLEIVEISFLSGTSASNISQIISWFTGNRVTNTTIAGISGCFLKYDLEIDDITDSYNREWTRISKVYRKSPSNYKWNDNYWL